MRRLRGFLIRLREQLGGGQADRELAQELDAHIEMLIAENMRKGMSEAEARRSARLHFGGRDQVMESCRDARGLPSLDSLLQDLRYAFRTMRRSPGFTAIAVLTLGVGIGVNAAVFTVTNAILFKGYPNADPQNRILYLNGNAGTSYPDVQDWSAQTKSFTKMAVVSSGGLRLILSDEDGARGTYDGTELSVNSFGVFEQHPILGRDFLPSDAVPGAPPVTILSYRLWENRYQKSPSVIGRKIRLDDDLTTVIGVMPAGFDFPHARVDLWVPLVTTANILKRENRTMWFAFGRMADGVTVQSAQVEMDTIAQRLEASYPLTNRGFRPRVSDFRSFNGPNAAVLYGSLWGAVGFVLLIACANLANFLLARSIHRSREISVRIALGAGRSRIIRQLLIESVLLSLLGGAFGWIIATGGVRAYELFAWPPGGYDHWHYPLDYTVFFYLLGISVLAGLLFGLAPAVVLSKLDVNATLKDGGRGTTISRGAKRLSTILVSGEVALAVVVLSGAGVMIRSFLEVYTADIGVKTANILTVCLRLPPQRYPSAQTQTAFFERLDGDLNTVPGVDSLALADSLPGLYAPKLAYELEGTPAVDKESRASVLAVTAGPAYFHTLDAALISGREFNDFDGPSAMPVVVVNEKFSSQLWPGSNPLGKRLRIFDGKTAGAWRTIVGVAPNIVQNFRRPTFDPVIYIPFRQRPAAAMDFLARTRVRPETLENTFRLHIQEMDPDLVVYSGLGSLDGPSPLRDSVVVFGSWSHGFNAGLFLVFAAIALLIASIGLYALVAHSLSRRTQEIGIRMALGATARDVRNLVLREGLAPVSIGLAIGLLASLAVNRLLKAELVNISPNDPIAMLAASGALMLTATLGCLIPARRAVTIDPAISLRHE